MVMNNFESKICGCPSCQGSHFGECSHAEEERELKAEHAALIKHNKDTTCSRHRWPYGCNDESGVVCPWCERLIAERAVSECRRLEAVAESCTSSDMLADATAQWLEQNKRWIHANELLLPSEEKGNHPTCCECGGNHEPSGARTDCIRHWKLRAIEAENCILVEKIYGSEGVRML